MKQFDFRRKKTLFSIVAHQRTGTHFLASMLKGTGKVHSFDEILFPAYSTDASSLSFYDHFRLEVERDPNNLLITDYSKVDWLFETFFDQLFGRTDKLILGFDIKIDQIDCFPRLFAILPRLGIKIVHIVRRNYLARVVSHEIMNRRVNAGEMDIHRVKQDKYYFSLDVDNTIDWMVRDEAANIFIENVFRNTDYLRIDYENLIEGQNHLDYSRLSGMLGIEERIEQSVPTTVRQNDRPLSDTLSNYDEIVSELRLRNLDRLLG